MEQRIYYKNLNIEFTIGLTESIVVSLETKNKTVR